MSPRPASSPSRRATSGEADGSTSRNVARKRSEEDLPSEARNWRSLTEERSAQWRSSRTSREQPMPGDAPERARHALEELESNLCGRRLGGSERLGEQLLDVDELVRSERRLASRANDLTPRPERRCALGVGAATPEDDRVRLRGRDPGGFAGEPRLAGPRLTDDEGEPTAPGGRSAHRIEQGRELGLPADEPLPARHAADGSGPRRSRSMHSDRTAEARTSARSGARTS